MRSNNRIPKRWLLPVLLMLTAVLLGVALLLVERGGSGGPPGQTGAYRPPRVTQPVQPGPTRPGEQTTDPGWTEPVQTSDPTRPGQGPVGDTEPDPDEEFEYWDPPEEELPKPTQPPDPFEEETLRCRQFARFSGQYVEDGRDELVKNVAAILVTNRTDRFLDLATMTYDIDGQRAVFVITGLPAGRSAWVMEAERLTIGEDAVFTHVETVTSFRGDVSADTKDISLYADTNLLTAVNNTDETLEDVFVYYKTLHTDGNFFGGITYRVEFGDLEPGASAQTLAGHYRSGETEIVRVGWADQ